MANVRALVQARETVDALQRNPAEFMKNAIVVVKFKSDAPPGVHQMTLKLMEHKLGSQLGRALPVYYLKAPVGMDPVFNAYWCPYMKNQARSVFVNNEANLMFTAQMDGCTLGLGTVVPGGGRSVMHINQGSYWAKLSKSGVMSEDTARGAQYDSQAQMIKDQLGQDSDLIGPRSYRRDADGSFVLASTTFGMRSNNNWQFHTQTFYTPDLTKYFLREVKQMV